MTAWPGSGLPSSTRFRYAHGAKNARATTATTPISRRRASPSASTVNQAMAAQIRASQTVSLRVSAPRPEQDAERQQPRVRQRRAARVAHDAGHEQARAEHDRGEQHRRVGQGRVEEQRQVDGRRQPGPERDPAGAVCPEAPLLATSSASRQASTGTSAPTSTLDTWAAGKVGPKIAIGIAARNVGSGSQTSNAGRGKTSGGVLIAPQRVADETAALEQVARHADVVRGVLRLREDDLRGEEGPHDQRDDEDQERR